MSNAASPCHDSGEKLISDLSKDVSKLSIATDKEYTSSIATSKSTSFITHQPPPTPITEALLRTTRSSNSNSDESPIISPKSLMSHAGTEASSPLKNAPQGALTGVFDSITEHILFLRQKTTMHDHSLELVRQWLTAQDERIKGLEKVVAEMLGGPPPPPSAAGE